MGMQFKSTSQDVETNLSPFSSQFCTYLTCKSLYKHCITLSRERSSGWAIMKDILVTSQFGQLGVKLL